MIGPVFERTTPRQQPTSSPTFTTTPGSGFPTAQHRFKTAFARARDQGDRRERRGEPPLVVSAQSYPAPIITQKPIPTDADALRRQIQEENARTIANMSAEEIEAEKRTILEQLGEGTGDLLRRVQEARLRKEKAALEEQAVQETGQTDRNPAAISSPVPLRLPGGLAAKPGVLRVKSLENISHLAPSPLPLTSSTRPSSRTGRKLRFAEVTPDDVHVYESAPRSPKQTVLALPPPPDIKDDSIVSLGTYKNTVPFKQSYVPELSTDEPADEQEPEEGTPEYIRRRYFPDVSPTDPNLEWMVAPSTEATDPSAPRFDLRGTPIPTSLSASLPSHLGLHHHAEGSHAGYTIDDIFHLSRSTVPAQRASMLGVLAKIAHRLGLQVRHPDSTENIVAFASKEGELRKRILTAGLAAVDQIGSLGACAVEVVWECLVQWDSMTNELERTELFLAPDIVSLLQLDYFLPKIVDVFSHAALPFESLTQLLAVVHWLAQQSNNLAETIVNTPRLVPTILSMFLLTPIPPREDSLPPNPLALQLLITLVSASRSNASALLNPADALLRFVALLPPSSPYPSDLASTLLTYTLRFYTALASYGLYSHIATTASQVFTALGTFLSPTSVSTAADAQFVQPRAAWASLLQAWIVCATDPHATSPPHEILWSQVCAWGWASDVRKQREGLGKKRSNWPIYTAIWDAEAAWLEGARINGIKGGEMEREEALQALASAFAHENGAEFGIVQCAVETVQQGLAEVVPTTIESGQRLLMSVADAMGVLASALRLFLACLPQLDEGVSLSAPPFALPLSALSALSATLVKHVIWSLPSTLGASYLRAHLRPLTRFIIYFHRVSRYIPATTPQLWFTQALVFLSRLLPGDESEACAMLNAFSLVTPQFVGIDPSQRIDVRVLLPFLAYTVRPKEEAYVAPLEPSTESIAQCTTLRLPNPNNPGAGEDNEIARSLVAGLPLTRDFLFAPLTHLLRSGTSPVFRALPGDWDASEVEVVRATLLLEFAVRKALIGHGLGEFAHDAGEVVFACMRVCMLEHGVGQTETEVFRDEGVERLMRCLLEPFTMRALAAAGGDATTTAMGTIERASAAYLGSTPFYQFYADLIALYGAVSFGHGLFASVVVTPLAMVYPVDYRRAWWCGGASGSEGDDGESVVRGSVRVPIEDVVCTRGVGLREYLYPVERDADVLGAYVRALVGRAGLDGFLRFLAVHHVASVVWGSGGDVDEETRARLLRVLAVRGNGDVVRDVARYRQSLTGTLVLAPACYGGLDGDERADRLGFVRRVVGSGVAADRMEEVLQ